MTIVRPKWIEEWYKSVLAPMEFNVATAELGASREWRQQDGAITHRTDRFFSIVGGAWEEHGQRRTQPFIKQCEIGTLAFVMRTRNGRPELLVQAKVEPGNVGIAQLAPTCQATASNLARVHGGATPPGTDVLARATIRNRSLQSEQGTRFYCKQNDNVLAQVDTEDGNSLTHRWVAVEDLLQLLPQDFLINTDARSVLVTSPWHKLVGRPPFTRDASTLSRELALSAATSDATAQERICAEMRALRKTASHATIIPLDQVTPDNRTFVIRHIRVSARGREVPAWDQPIIDSAGEGLIELVCGRRNGILHYLFTPRREPGLYNRIELGPSRCIEPGSSLPSDYAAKTSGKVLLECRQSEEGGRFFQDVNRFRIIDAGNAPATDAESGGYWLPLGSVQKMLLEGGWFTNEARSALALLLSWL